MGDADTEGGAREPRTAAPAPPRGPRRRAAPGGSGAIAAEEEGDPGPRPRGRCWGRPVCVQWDGGGPSSGRAPGPGSLSGCKQAA